MIELLKVHSEMLLFMLRVWAIVMYITAGYFFAKGCFEDMVYYMLCAMFSLLLSAVV